MATYDYTVVVDGIAYKAGETVPDMGSIVNTSETSQRTYGGLYSDFSKLPTVATNPKYNGRLVTGNDAFLVDADGGHYCYYERTTDTWYKC